MDGLYIHIPFCKSKCVYCDFYSVTDTRLIPRFIDALIKEAEAWQGEFKEFDTIYFGGGTPSLLALNQIEILMDKIHASFKILPDPEITIEINPADWEQKDLKSLRRLGINRISIGIQSFDNQELIFLGRRHNSKQAVRTLEDAANAGFDNISIDLIYDLPGQSFDKWKSSLTKALNFGPSHVSCYELEIKPHTPLGLRCEKGEFPISTEDSQRDFFMRTSELLEGSGYIHYEVSNFAKGMDKASRHNQKYWDHTPYLGLGPSAHSFKDHRRWWNHDALSGYLCDLDEGKVPIRDSERLSGEQLRMEALFLGLRTRKGIDLNQYRQRYSHDLMKGNGPVLKELSASGLIEIKDGFIRPTHAGMAVADSLALL